MNRKYRSITAIMSAVLIAGLCSIDAQAARQSGIADTVFGEGATTRPRYELDSGDMIRTSITDEATGLGIASCTAPWDFTVHSEVDWCTEHQSPSNPGQVFITALSPDENTSFSYASTAEYIHYVQYSYNGTYHPIMEEGSVDENTLTMMLAYMDADEYCDYVAENSFEELDPERVSQREKSSAQKRRIELERAEYLENLRENYEDIEYATIQDVFVDVAECTYEVEIEEIPCVMTVLACTEGYQINFDVTRDMDYGFTTRQTIISWDVPYVYCLITPQDEYKRQHQLFERFAMETGTSDQFQEAALYSGDYIWDYVSEKGASGMPDVRSFVLDYYPDLMGDQETYDYTLDSLVNDMYGR